MLQLRIFMVATALLCVAAIGCAPDQEVIDETAAVAEPFESTEEAQSYVQDLVTAGPEAEQQAVDVDDPEQELRRNDDVDCHWCGNTYRCCVFGPEGQVCYPASC